jgi:hypothetical protein
MADRDRRTTAVIDPSAVTDSSAYDTDSAAAPHRWRHFALLVGPCAVGAAAVLP